MNRKALVVFTISALAIHAGRSQNLITNGSFELPVVPPNTFQTGTPDSWSWNGGTPGFIFNGNVPSGFDGYTAYWPPPEDGQQYVDIGPNSFGPFSQTFTVTNQGNYTLTWFDNAPQSGGLTAAPYSVEILTMAGQVVTSNSLDSYNLASTWTARTNQAFLSAGTYKLQFAGVGDYGGLDALIDNVSLQEVQDFSDLLTTIHVSAVDVCWSGHTNQMYQPQYTTDLNSTNWTNLGPQVLGAGDNCITDTNVAGNPKRFYRVIRVP